MSHLFWSNTYNAAKPSSRLCCFLSFCNYCYVGALAQCASLLTFNLTSCNGVIDVGALVEWRIALHVQPEWLQWSGWCGGSGTVLHTLDPISCIEVTDVAALIQ